MPAKIFTILTIIITALLFTIFSNVILAEKYGKISEEEWNTSPPVEDPNAGAVVIFEHGELDISIHEITLKHHVRIKVFNKNVAENVINIELPFYKKDKLHAFKAHTITSDGKKHKVKDKYEKTTEWGKVISFTFPAISDNVILEYEYKLVHQRYWFLDPWYFQNPVFTMESEFTIYLYDGFSYNILKRNLPGDKLTYITEDLRRYESNVKKFSWSLKDISAAKDEPMAGVQSTYEMSLVCQLYSYKDPWNNISFIESWGDIGDLLTKDFNDFTNDKWKMILIRKFDFCLNMFVIKLRLDMIMIVIVSNIKILMNCWKKDMETLLKKTLCS